MKRSPKLRFAAILLLAACVSMIAIKCKKNVSAESSSAGKTTPEMIAKMDAMRKKQIADGIVIFDKKFAPGEVVQSGRKHPGQERADNVGCEATDSLFINDFMITYKNGDCNTPGNYVATITYAIKVSATSVLINYTPLTTVFDAYNGSSILGTASPTSVFINRSGQYWNFVATVDITSYYCSMTRFFFTAYTKLQCYDFSVTYYDPIGIYNGVAGDRGHPCRNWAPVFFYPKVAGAGTMSVGGWITCVSNPSNNPCFAMPNKVVISYRVAGGTGAWSTYTLNPYLNSAAAPLPSLTADIYDVKWHNENVTPYPCIGEESPVVQYDLR